MFFVFPANAFAADEPKPFATELVAFCEMPWYADYYKDSNGALTAIVFHPDNIEVFASSLAHPLFYPVRVTKHDNDISLPDVTLTLRNGTTAVILKSMDRKSLLRKIAEARKTIADKR